MCPTGSFYILGERAVLARFCLTTFNRPRVQLPTLSHLNMKIACPQICLSCHWGINCINGRYCTKVRKYVTHHTVALCETSTKTSTQLNLAL
nr:MAG TPA: hypothetical protein [Caudoviricetes sp.]